jgi:hypothetical protein
LMVKAYATGYQTKIVANFAGNLPSLMKGSRPLAKVAALIAQAALLME